MKKNFTFYDLILKKRLLGLIFLLLLCNKNFAQTFCRPVSNTNSVSGICIGTSVNNPTAAYDNDAGLTTYTTLSTVLGVLCSAQETLVLNQTAKAGDQIVLYIGSGAGLLNLSLLSTGTIQPKFNGTNVGSAVAINNPLLNLALLPGNTIGVLRYTLTGDANQVQIQLGGVVSALTDLRIYDVRLEFAAPTVTGGLNQTICSGNSTTLTATPAAGTTVAWYSSPTSTTALANTNSYTTPVLTANTTYYIGVTRATGCEGNERVPVVINVSNPVSPVISTVGTAICSTGATQQTTLSVINPIPGTTYNWYSGATGGPVLASGNTYSPTVPLGTTSFYVEAAIGSCLSPARTQVDVISNAVPVLPTVLTQSVTIQSGQNATLSAENSQVGVTLNWYDVATGGTALAINTPTYTTPILTATKTFYVEAQSAAGNCVSATRVPIIVTVIPSALGGCLEAGSQQTVQNGLCLLCSSTNPNNSVDGNPATAARLTVPVGLINGYIQQTLQFNNPGRAGDIVDVDLELPGGLADVQLLGAISLATYNGATYNNDRIAVNNPLITLQLLSGTRYRASVVAGANFDRVEIRLGGLATVLTSVDIYQATYRYKAPTFTGATTICSGQTATLVANIAVGETINWYNVATNGVSLASSTTYTTPVLTTPTTYYVEIARNGCVNSERFPVLISIDNPVAPVISISGTTICSGQTTALSVDAPVVGTVYTWYDTASAGNLLSTGNSFATPNLTADTTYYVEAGIGSCSSATRTPVTVTVNPLPTTPIAASSNVIIQSGQSAALQVSSPDSNVTFDWYSVPTGGTVLATGTATYTTPILTANQTYYVTARNITSNCISSARTAINVIISNSISTCLQPNAQIITASTLPAVCALCSGTGGVNSYDGNINSFASLNIPLGVLGAYVQQELTFPNPGQAGDIIDVTLELPGGLADVSLLGSVSLATYNGVTYNNDRLQVNNNLLNLQVLSGNKFKVSFPTSAAFDKLEIRLGALVGLLTTLNIYEVSYRFKDAIVTGATAPICNGQIANLAATSNIAGETFKWYDSASGGIELSPSATYTTPSLIATTTYYLEATRGGTCINSVRQPVTVTVAPFATAADVTITSPQEASCAGGIVLSPTSPLVGAQFKYYTDQNKTQEIITGSTVLAQPGVTFSKDVITGALTISGLSAAGAPYNYYISVANASTCENDINNLKQVIVNFPTVTPLTVIAAPLVGCGTVNLANAITGFDTTGNTTYTFYDPSNNILPANAAANINTSGVYLIQAQGNGVTCPSVILPVTVTINPLPTLTVNPAQSVIVGTDVTLIATSNGTITWFDPQANAITASPTSEFKTGALNTPGIYTYTVVATLGTCTRTGTLSINVKDPDNCQSLTKRVYADGQSSGSIITGGVTNASNAKDGNPQTFSTIVTGLGVLGVGTTWQNLTWSTKVGKGTPVTIKLGSEYSGVALGQNLSVVATKAGADIGEMQPVSGALLNLLSGDNTYEFTFVPADAAGPQDYDGIRIQSASLLSVAQNTKVFDAYYYASSVPPVTCTPGDIQDIFYGATDLGLPVGALTATVGVSDAQNIADNDVSTFATMYSGVGALAAADLTVQFKTPSIVSDTLRIVISKPSVLLDVNLLTGFTIQRYLGNVAVGAPIQNTNTLLSIRLLPGNTLAMVLVSSPTESYDRVRIRFGGVAGVLEFLRVHTVERVANTSVIDGGTTNKVTVCPGSDVTLQIPEEACSTYVWYDAPTGGSIVANGLTYTVPANLASGTYKYYVQPVRYGCEAMTRGEVTVEVKVSSPENLLTDITLNGATSTTICAPTGTVTLATTLTATGTITNPVYHWYKFDGTTSQPVAGATASSLTVTGLTPGTYTYFVGFSSDEYCETAEGDRKQITFTILRPSDQNDLSVSDVSICHDLPVTLTPTASLLTNPVFYWYLDNNKTQPITNGSTIGGVTYAISTSGVLTATGITLAMSPISYYVGVSSDATCENIAGTLQTATVIINDPGTPIITKTTQDFCLINTPTFATIDVSPADAANIVWYSTQTGGIAIASTTALTTGTYYAAIKDPTTSCESAIRLAVTISVTDPGTPVITNTTQDFCLVNAPTFATIDVSPAVAANIVWYSSATGGTAIPSTTALTTGTYYAAIKDPITTCESNVRLAIAISVTDPGTPVITNTTQDFCLVNAPTFATINVSPATNIVWYDALTGGNLIPSTTALTTGTYYAAIKDPTTTCESNVRLAIAISVTDPGTPIITKTTQDFCLINAPTFATIDVSPAVAANIVWYDALTGGNLIPSTTALTTGTYYAAIKDPTTTCESNVRLAIAISVTDPGTPVITNTTQDFCLVNAPTFATIDVSPAVAANIVWYDALTGGNLIPSTTALTTGTYYAAIKDPTTTCESNVRLAIAISVTDPGTPVITNTTQDFCLVNAPTFATINVSPATNIVWYDALTGGNLIPSTTALTTGTYYAAIKDPTTTCESNVRLAIAISVTDPGTPVITNTTQDFCLVNAPTFATINVSPATNIVWYDALTGGNLIPSTTALTTGTYYAAIKDPTTTCESNVRLAIAISVTDPGTPVITNTTQDFCLVNAPTFATIDVSPAVAANIVWYDALTGGNLIPSTTALTTGTYYAAIKDPTTTCESNVRLAIAISVTDPGTPVITNTTQDFCLVNAPTFATINVSPATNIVWYDALTGGNLIPSTTALTTGTYYAAIKDPTTTCESNVRLAIAISVTDPGTPVITKTTQDFCLINAPTFATIDVSPAVAANIVWYDALTGGNLIPSTTALTTGTYYAAIKDPTTTCESNVRLAIAISVTDPGTPVITNTTQNFCLVNAPTFATINVSPATNIVWYDALTGGNLIPSTTALTTGTYYAAIKDPTTTCESNVRLAIAISVTDPGTPVITNTTQDFCLVNAPTFATINVSPAMNIVWYDALTGGNLIPSTTALTTGTYYAAIKDPTTTCESNVRLAIAISVTDPGTPVITKTTQDFCLINAPTFATIDVSPAVAANIVWYDALTGGNLIPSTTALTTGTYYAAIKDPTTTCESNVRLAIAISVTDPGTPVITNTTQDFCLVNAPTFATINVSPATNIVWYDAVTGGNLIPSTTALTTGTYYAAIKDPITTCESNVRLAIAISVTDPGTPVITNTTQNFCLVNTPTFATINVSPATNIVWYDAMTGGNLIPSTTALTTGTYYAAIKDPTTTCESNVRLAIAISVTDPGTPVITNTTQNFCLVNTPTFATIDVSPAVAANIVWYDALTGGNLIPSTTALTTGTYYAAIKDPITNCESAVRLAVAISVTDPGTPTTTENTQDFCLVNAPTVANIQVNETNVVWYNTQTGGTVIPAATALVNGIYYGAILDPVTNCESATRLQVTISISNPLTPTTTATTQNFCLVNAPTIANIQVNEPNVVWYSTVTGGTALASTTVLTSGVYYGAIKDPVTGCESSVRLQVTINVTDPGTPTTADNTQDFCLVNAPTIANIQVNEANLIWYSTATGGTSISATTALASGIYYGAILDPLTNCESATRLQVTINLINPATPTTTNASQSFCITNAPTVASIQVNEANVVWYSTLTGGTLLASTAALTNGIYYGAIKDPVTGCESSVRLQVAVSINNPAATPTTSAATQNFCSLNSPTVANIQVNEANVVWYSTATGGTAIPATTALATGTYYGAISSTVGCENPIRLAVVVNVNTPGVITTPRTTQTFCLSKLPTLASILVNETNVVWYSSATGGTPLAVNTQITAGTYYASALNNTTNGCESATRLGVTINFENDALVPITTSDDTPCVFQGVTYSIANGKSNYVWSVTNGTIVSGGGTADGSVTISWSDIGPGQVKVTYINNCDETTTKTLNVTVATCSDLTITNTVSNPTPNFGEQITFTVTVNNVGQGNFINTVVSDLLPSGYDLVSTNTTAGTYDPATSLWTIPTLNAGQSVTLTIVAEVLSGGDYLSVATVEISTPLDVNAANNTASVSVDPICLTVYNEFTPNNDGANDFFRIDCIESYPNNELKVYNRYGSLVYSKQHYENDWNGTANVSGVINRGDMLPTGTYFYVIDIGDGTVKKGWLSIMR